MKVYAQALDLINDLYDNKYKYLEDVTTPIEVLEAIEELNYELHLGL